MNKKIRVGAVSYLNTKPLTYAFEQGAMQEQIDLRFEYPSKLANQLLNDEIDIGLVPVAVIPMLKECYIITDFCIATQGEVASVCLFSDVQLHEIKTILLDYQSKTSVALLKILLKHHWKISPVLLDSADGYESNIQGSTAGLVIGDRAFSKRNECKYIYDLGIGWKEMTGLPFVFAAWVANKKIPEDFIADYNYFIQQGLNNIDAIVQQVDFPVYNLHSYYTKNIDYRLDSIKLQALNQFIEMIE